MQQVLKVPKMRDFTLIWVKCVKRCRAPSVAALLSENHIFPASVFIFAVLGYKTGTKVVGWVIGGINDKQMPSLMVNNTVKTGGGSIRKYLCFYETRTRCWFVEEGSAGVGPTWTPPMFHLQNLRPDLSHPQITVASVTGDRFQIQNWKLWFVRGADLESLSQRSGGRIRWCRLFSTVSSHLGHLGHLGQCW